MTPPYHTLVGTVDSILEKLPSFIDDIRSLKETIITNIVLIGQTPAPTFKEKRRAILFQERLTESHVDECTTDGYRNPIGIIRGTKRTHPPIFVVAHLDTFFDQDVDYNYTVRKSSVRGPGILDNSIGVGVVASLPLILQKLGLRFESDLVLAGVIQSIGRGNLRGIRHLLKTWSTPIRGAVCIEGIELGRLNYYSDGMIRGEIHCNITQTDRMVHQFDPNAILILNEVLNEILKLRLPQRPRSRIVVGKIAGGVNYGDIAYEANMGFEIRSDSDEMVKQLFGDIEDIIAGISHERKVDLKLKTISNLGAARLRFNHPLVKSASAVMEKLDLKPISEPSESELSIFHAHDIPAITVGMTRGSNRYQVDARMRIAPLFRGITQLIGILMAIDSGVCDE